VTLANKNAVILSLSKDQFLFSHSQLSEITFPIAEEGTLAGLRRLTELILRQAQDDGFYRATIIDLATVAELPMNLARTPEPPYYAVIFSSLRTEGEHGYEAMARRMVELAAQQPGFLGVDTTRGAEGLGLTVSYWKDLASIAQWKKNPEHLDAQRKGRNQWYANFVMRIAKVEREYSL